MEHQEGSETKKPFFDGRQGYQLYATILVEMKELLFIRCLKLREFFLLVKLIFSVIIFSLVISIITTVSNPDIPKKKLFGFGVRCKGSTND